jgi:hypothetical protein
MTTNKRDMQVHVGSGNAYADLGFPNASSNAAKGKGRW